MSNNISNEIVFSKKYLLVTKEYISKCFNSCLIRELHEQRNLIKFWKKDKKKGRDVGGCIWNVKTYVQGSVRMNRKLATNT